MITAIYLGSSRLDANGRYLTGIKNLSFPESVQSGSRKGGYYGQKLSPVMLGGFRFSTEWTIAADSFSALATAGETFASYLWDIIGSGSQTLKISKSNGIDIQIDVVGVTLTGDVVASDGISRRVLIEFASEYPFLVSQGQITENIYINQAGGMGIPMGIPMDMSVGGTETLSLLNYGNCDAYPTITLYGALTNPSLTNLTTGETINITYTLDDSNDYIVIDIFNRTVLLYPGATNARQYFSGDFFTLVPGLNEISLNSGVYNTSGKATFVYRDHYLGI